MSINKYKNKNPWLKRGKFSLTYYMRSHSTEYISEILKTVTECHKNGNCYLYFLKHVCLQKTHFCSTVVCLLWTISKGKLCHWTHYKTRPSPYGRRAKGNRYLLFHNMVNQETVWGWANALLVASLQFPMRSWLLGLQLFSAKDLFQQCFTEPQLETQGALGFRQTGAGKIVTLGKEGGAAPHCACASPISKPL